MTLQFGIWLTYTFYSEEAQCTCDMTQMVTLGNIKGIIYMIWRKIRIGSIRALVPCVLWKVHADLHTKCDDLSLDTTFQFEKNIHVIVSNDFL